MNLRFWGSFLLFREEPETEKSRITEKSQKM